MNVNWQAVKLAFELEEPLKVADLPCSPPWVLYCLAMLYLYGSYHELDQVTTFPENRKHAGLHR